MTALNQTMKEWLVDFTERRRRYLIGIGSTIVAYALLGFIVAPWLVSKVAIDSVATTLNSELRLDRVAINPFVMSVRIDGLALDDASGAPVARAQSIYVNFQLSSLFRWAWSFAEIRFDGPELYVTRDKAGSVNLATLVPKRPEPVSPPAPETSGGLPRLFIHEFVINAAEIDWRDAVPADPVETVFGPISVQVSELNTLPDRSGEQAVVITTETQGTLSWTGSLQLNPLVTSGHAEVRGSHFPLTSAYIRHETGLEIVEGLAGIDFDYAVSTDADGQVRAAVTNLGIEFLDLHANTFHAQPDEMRQPREFLTVSRVVLEGGSLKWPEREVTVGEFRIDDANLDLVRLVSGELDFAIRDAKPGTVNEEPDAAPDDGGDAWNLSLDLFTITGLAVGLVDQSVTPAADIGVRDVNLSIREMSNTEGAAFPTSLTLVAREGGIVQLNGPVTVLPEPIIDFELAIDDLVLAGAHPYVQPLADVNLDSGVLNIDGRIRHNVSERLAIDADVEIVDFLITETDEGTRLGSWARLLIDQLALSVNDNTLGISEIRLEQPYADILIAADGSVNLGRISKGEQSNEPDTVTPEAGSELDNEPAMTVTIGRIVIDNAASDFADESLPLPFSAKIHDLNGSLTTIATSSSEPSSVDLEGAVDEFGLVRVTGSVTPLEFSKDTDLKVRFENVDVPKFSAYTIRFAGREIASGRLDLDLGYQVSDKQLVGENKIVLRDFELGEEAPHPGAASLPLGLAVALLKDSSGTIDVDLPVRGDLDDPEFGYGRVIGKALATLIVKIVASPFTLLGKLVGVEPDELEYISFPAGRADLTPPELERVQKLTEALALRPELVLEVGGVIDRKADALALKTTRVDEAVEARITIEAEGEDDGYADRRLEILETMHRESSNADPALLDALRAAYTSNEIDEETGKEVSRFDAPAYAAAIREQLIANEKIDEKSMVELARSRASNARDALLGIDSALENRISVVDSREEEGTGSDDTVRMKVSLTVLAAPISAGREQ